MPKVDERQYWNSQTYRDWYHAEQLQETLQSNQFKSETNYSNGSSRSSGDISAFLGMGLLIYLGAYVALSVAALVIAAIFQVVIWSYIFPIWIASAFVLFQSQIQKTPFARKERWFFSLWLGLAIGAIGAFFTAYFSPYTESWGSNEKLTAFGVGLLFLAFIYAFTLAARKLTTLWYVKKGGDPLLRVKYCRNIPLEVRSLFDGLPKSKVDLFGKFSKEGFMRGRSDLSLQIESYDQENNDFSKFVAIKYLDWFFYNKEPRVMSKIDLENHYKSGETFNEKTIKLREVFFDLLPREELKWLPEIHENPFPRLAVSPNVDEHLKKILMHKTEAFCEASDPAAKKRAHLSFWKESLIRGRTSVSLHVEHREIFREFDMEHFMAQKFLDWFSYDAEPRIMSLKTCEDYFHTYVESSLSLSERELDEILISDYAQGLPDKERAFFEAAHLYQEGELDKPLISSDISFVPENLKCLIFDDGRRRAFQRLMDGTERDNSALDALIQISRLFEKEAFRRGRSIPSLLHEYRETSADTGTWPKFRAQKTAFWFSPNSTEPRIITTNECKDFFRDSWTSIDRAMELRNSFADKLPIQEMEWVPVSLHQPMDSP